MSILKDTELKREFESFKNEASDALQTHINRLWQESLETDVRAIVYTSCQDQMNLINAYAAQVYKSVTDDIQQSLADFDSAVETRLAKVDAKLAEFRKLETEIDTRLALLEKGTDTLPLPAILSADEAFEIAKKKGIVSKSVQMFINRVLREPRAMKRETGLELVQDGKDNELGVRFRAVADK